MKAVFPIVAIGKGFWSLIQGMQVTIKEFFRPDVTVRYPYETLTMAPRFRGHIEMLKEPDTGRPVCTACTLCAKACPSGCITLAGGKNEEAKRRMVTAYQLDFTKCSLCGACVEACQEGAIRFSKAYNLASGRREDYTYDLLKSMKVKEP